MDPYVAARRINTCNFYRLKETLNTTTETKDYFHVLTTLYAKAKIKLSKQTAENKSLNDRLKTLEVFIVPPPCISNPHKNGNQAAKKNHRQYKLVIIARYSDYHNILRFI